VNVKKIMPEDLVVTDPPERSNGRHFAIFLVFSRFLRRVAAKPFLMIGKLS